MRLALSALHRHATSSVLFTEVHRYLQNVMRVGPAWQAHRTCTTFGALPVECAVPCAPAERAHHLDPLLRAQHERGDGPVRGLGELIMYCAWAYWRRNPRPHCSAATIAVETATAAAAQARHNVKRRLRRDVVVSQRDCNIPTAAPQR